MEKERLDIEKLQGLFPDFTDEEWHDVLWEATAFPCAGAVHIEKQVQEHYDAGFRTADSIIAYAYWLLDFTMDLYQPRLKLLSGGE